MTVQPSNAAFTKAAKVATEKKPTTKYVVRNGNVYYPFLEPEDAATLTGSFISAATINASFGIPTNDTELQPVQQARQQKLQDAVIAFSAPVAYNIERSTPVWDLPIHQMKQQQQRGMQLSMTDDERADIQKSQLAAQTSMLTENRAMEARKQRQPACSIIF